MSGFSCFLLSLCILGCIFCCSQAWHVQLPRNIKGLLGSCLVIPCSFGYTDYPPNRPDRVVWYQYVSSGYPLVYDSWNPNGVINIFKGKTSREFTRGKDCSLRIFPLTWFHHRQKIYPWVDPENVGRRTYRFFDKTVTIEVTDLAEKPNITIFGDMKVGQSVTVKCSVDHMCFTNPPSLQLNVPLQSHRLRPSTTTVPSGVSTTSLETTMTIEREHQTVDCSAQYTGGQTATASKVLNAECSFWPLKIQSPAEFLEGQASVVTCTAYYTCPQHLPEFSWSYSNVPASTTITKTGKARWMAVSKLMFTASASDISLTCSAKFSGDRRQSKSITFWVKRNMLSRGWYFTTPHGVTGMRGSCIIVPCRFTYSTSQPAGLRVIWYLFQGNGYTPAFDEKQDVMGKFSGITSLIGTAEESNCSLKIERLEMSHNHDRLFPWVDENPITFYHTLGYTFYDKSTQLTVLDHAQEPQLSIAGNPRVGDLSWVYCSARHTCVSAPPTLTINGVHGTDRIVDILVSDGIWERRLERNWTTKEEDHSVKCTVSYRGGQRATSELTLNVECPYEEIRMTEPPDNTTEGVAQPVICSVSYKCTKNAPTIVWNYKDMQISFYTERISSNTFKAVSNMTFIGSLDDDGKALTCTAQFIAGITTDSRTIRVNKYEKPLEIIDKNEADRILAADVPFRFTGLTRSCVVIPCSFQYTEDVYLKKGMWSKKNGGFIFHNAQTRVLDHFKGRTKIIGNLDEGNCSLEIDDIKPFDNGPFCFHAEGRDEKYRFNNSCVFIVMKASPENPVMSPVPEEVKAGSIMNVSCSVRHTCSSHPPEFSWNVSSLTSEVTHTMMPQGVWSTNSTITFMAAGGDYLSLTCTAKHWRGKEKSSTVKLMIKGSLMYQLRSSLAVAVPVAVLIVIILAAVSGVLFLRKRKHLRPPPRPDKRTKPESRPPRPEKRRSMWSRFSRHDDNSVNFSVDYFFAGLQE